MPELLELLPQGRPVGAILGSFNVLLVLQLALDVVPLTTHRRSNGRTFATHGLCRFRVGTGTFDQELGERSSRSQKSIRAAVGSSRNEK